MGQQSSVPEDMDQTVEVLSTASGRFVCLSGCPSSSNFKVLTLRSFNVVGSFGLLANSKFRNAAGQFPSVFF